MTQSGQQPVVFPAFTAGRNHHNFNEHARSPKVGGEAARTGGFSGSTHSFQTEL
jgi:hypothetical protein